MVNIGHAQNNRAFIPPDWENRAITYTFTAPELRVNSAFIDSLNTILFDPKCSAANIYDGPKDKPWKDFYLLFVKKDSLNYSIRISLNYHPGRESKGFFEHDGYRYWFYGEDAPPNIVMGVKAEKQFSYTSLPGLLKSLSWDVRYNRQTGKITVKDVSFD